MANVYAPNKLNDSCYPWDEMVKFLPKDCKWILARDWNMVEAKKDKFNNRGRFMSQFEKLAWEQMLEHQ